MIWRWLVAHGLRSAARHTASTAFEEAVKQASEDSGESAGGHSPSGPLDIVVCFALPIEAGYFTDRLQDTVQWQAEGFQIRAGRLHDRQVAAVLTGVGREAARRAVENVLKTHHPRWVIASGFAGSLQSHVRRGHLVMAHELADEQGQVLDLGVRFPPEAREDQTDMHAGRILTVGTAVTDPREKSRLAEQSGALAVDMESWEIAQACARHETRCLVLRVISDEVDQALPPEVEKLAGTTTLATRMGLLTGAFVRRPGVAKDLWRLREDAIVAADRLASGLADVIRQLPA